MSGPYVVRPVDSFGGSEGGLNFISFPNGSLPVLLALVRLFGRSAQRPVKALYMIPTARMS